MAAVIKDYGATGISQIGSTQLEQQQERHQSANRGMRPRNTSHADPDNKIYDPDQRNTRRLLLAIVVIAFICSTSLLMLSAFPAFETKSNLAEFGDFFVNSSGLITIDGNVASVELTVIEPLRYDLEVNITTSSTKPPISSTILKSLIQIDLPLKEPYRAGCNYFAYDEPIYLQPNSSFKYKITSSNYEAMSRLCYFKNTDIYTKFLANETFQYDSNFCFNISDSNTIINITVHEASLYYFALDTKGNTTFLVDITINRFYYEFRRLQDSSLQCSLSESSNFLCIIKICPGYICEHFEDRYMIVESSGHVMLKYDTLTVFYFMPVVRVILFSFGLFFEIIAVTTVALMIYKWKKNGSQNKCTIRKRLCFIVVMVMLLITSLHLTAISFLTNNIHEWSVNNSTSVRVGNMYPVLLNSQKLKSVSTVEINWSFPSAISVSVYKVPCNNLKTSSKKLGPIEIKSMVVFQNSRVGFNFRKYNIPLNLAPRSKITYNVSVSSNTTPSNCSNYRSALPSNCSAITCIRLVLMDSIEAYDEFLSIPKTTNFTNYISLSDCLSYNGESNASFTIKHEQNDYYIGIETPIDITVHAEVSGDQVYYDVSNEVNVCSHLSVNNPSCNVQIRQNFLNFYFDKQNDACLLVDSSNFDVISYSGDHKILATVTFLVLVFLAIICALIFIILGAILVCLKICAVTKVQFKNMSSDKKKKLCILTSLCIFILIVVEASLMCTAFIISQPVNITGKAWIQNTKDFVLILQPLGSKWVGSHDILFSIENSNSTEVSLYTVRCKELVPAYHHTVTNKRKLECQNFCILNESIYLVKSEGVYVNYSISLSSNIDDQLPFSVSAFDDYDQYNNFLSKTGYNQVNIEPNTIYTNGNRTSHFNFSHHEMKEKAAYYQFILHSRFNTDVYKYSHYYSNCSVQMESNISYYNLTNYNPHKNITSNSTLSIKDNICVLARANTLVTPILLTATSTATSKNQIRYFLLLSAFLSAVVICTIFCIASFIISKRSSYMVSSPVVHKRKKGTSRPRIYTSNEELSFLDDDSAEKDEEPDSFAGQDPKKGSKPIQKLLNNIKSIYNCKVDKLNFDSSGLVHYCSEYGVTLIIPKGAVQKPATVWFAACLFSDRFKFGHYMPVTPIVWVYIDQELAKPATLYLPHHIDTNSLCDKDAIAVLKADDNETGPTTFVPTSSSEIKLHNIWRGSSTFMLSAKHFCSTCVAENVRSEPQKKRFLTMSALKREADKVYIDICFLIDQPNCEETLRSQYIDTGYDIINGATQRVNIDQNNRLSLSLNEEVAAWTFTCEPEFISVEQIDYQKICEERGIFELRTLERNLKYPPRFSIKFERNYPDHIVEKDVTILVHGTIDELSIPFELILDDYPASPPKPIEVTDTSEECFQCRHILEVIKHNREIQTLVYFRDCQFLCKSCTNNTLPVTQHWDAGIVHQTNSDNFSDDYSEPEEDSYAVKDEQATDDLLKNWIFVDKVQELKKDLESIAKSYKMLGKLFYIHDDIIAEIEQEHNDEPVIALEKILKNWLQWKIDYAHKLDDEKPNRRWLVSAIEKIDALLAENLKTNYIKMHFYF